MDRGTLWQWFQPCKRSLTGLPHAICWGMIMWKVCGEDDVWGTEWVIRCQEPGCLDAALGSLCKNGSNLQTCQLQINVTRCKKLNLFSWVCAYNLSTLEAEAGFEFKASLGSTVRYSVGYILRSCLKRTKYKPIRRKKKKKEKKMKTTLVQICFHPTKRSILWNNHVASTQEIGKPVKQEGQPGLTKKPCLKNRNKK